MNSPHHMKDFPLLDDKLRECQEAIYLGEKKEKHDIRVISSVGSDNKRNQKKIYRTIHNVSKCCKV